MSTRVPSSSVSQAKAAKDVVEQEGYTRNSTKSAADSSVDTERPAHDFVSPRDRARETREAIARVQMTTSGRPVRTSNSVWKLRSRLQARGSNVKKSRLKTESQRRISL